MTARQAIALLLLGYAGDLLGALFKIQHWPLASLILIASMVLQVVAALVLVLKVLSYPGFKDFLDR